MKSIFRIIWGILTLVALGWVCYGLSVVSGIASNQLERAGAQASSGAQVGTAIGAGLSTGIVLCTGIPFLLLFGFLYWRNGVAIREEKRHNETINAMRGQQQ